MLDKVFFAVLSMALSASFVILVVLAARFALKKAPKAVSCALWGVVLFRLLCPVSFESMLSLQRIRPDAVKPQIVYQAAPQIESGIEPIDRAVNAALPASSPQASVNPLQIWTFAGEMIWLSGIVTLLLYSIVTLARLRKRLVGTVLLEDNVWLCDGVETPFVLGMLKPKIYLPSAIDAHERDYILLHECTHIRRGDNVVKPVFFLTLCVYWFNPLVWLAFFLCGRDMELSCDEAVMKRLGADTRCDYSASLLRLSTGKRIVAGAPLAFGEGSVKGRIKNVLDYKKPAFWAVWLSVAAVAVLCFTLIANPKSANASTVVYFAPLSEGYAFTLRLPDSCQSFIANGSFTADEGGVKTFYAGGFHDGTGAAAEGDALFRLIARTADSYAARSDTDPNARFLGTCGGYTVYAVFSDGSKVSAAHKERYDKMLADLKTQLTTDSFSRTGDGISVFWD